MSRETRASYLLTSSDIYLGHQFGLSNNFFGNGLMVIGRLPYNKIYKINHFDPLKLVSVGCIHVYLGKKGWAINALCKKDFEYATLQTVSNMLFM